MLPLLNRFRSEQLDANGVFHTRPDDSRPWPPHPVEGVRIYHDYCRLVYDRQVNEETLTEKQTRRLRRVIANHCFWTGRPLFINDQSANIQRLRQMMAIFPEARFIHVIRDGRDVAWEMMQRSWWEEAQFWWRGLKTRAWKKAGRQPLLLAGLHWKISIETVRAQAAVLGPRYLEIRYEALIKQTRETLLAATAHAQIAVDGHWLNTVPRQINRLTPPWHETMPQCQQLLFNERFGRTLDALGYKRQ